MHVRLADLGGPKRALDPMESQAVLLCVSRLLEPLQEKQAAKSTF